MAFDFDVYLMDEVSSAGDERFRKRSKKRLEELNQKQILCWLITPWVCNFTVIAHFAA